MCFQPQSDNLQASHKDQNYPKLLLTCEDAHEGDTQGDVIVAISSGALVIPAHPFINTTILAHEEAGEAQER